MIAGPVPSSSKTLMAKLEPCCHLTQLSTLESPHDWWNSSYSCLNSRGKDTVCLCCVTVHLCTQESLHNPCPPPLVLPWPCLLALQVPGPQTLGFNPGKAHLREICRLLYLCNLILISKQCLLRVIFPSRKRMNAFREVTPMDLPNCHFIKGISMYEKRKCLIWTESV